MTHSAARRTSLIIWIVMGASQLIILGIGAVLAPPSNPGATTTAQMLAFPAMMTASASIALGVIPGLLPGTPAQTRHILRWALAESAGLFGLVSLMISGEALYQYACAIMGLIAWAVAVPKDDLPSAAG